MKLFPCFLLPPQPPDVCCDPIFPFPPCFWLRGLCFLTSSAVHVTIVILFLGFIGTYSTGGFMLIQAILCQNRKSLSTLELISILTFKTLKMHFLRIPGLFRYREIQWQVMPILLLLDYLGHPMHLAIVSYVKTLWLWSGDSPGFPNLLFLLLPCPFLCLTFIDLTLPFSISIDYILIWCGLIIVPKCSLLLGH